MTPLEISYSERFTSTLEPLSRNLAVQLREYLERTERIDGVSVRAKSLSRFIDKANKVEGGIPKYDDPLNQIQDQIGARIVTFYKSDVDRVAEIVGRYYRSIEAKDLVPENDSEFGYIGKHFILLIPADLQDPKFDKTTLPPFFELQIKTLFQHAWSEANHDLGYKNGSTPLSSEENRRIAFTAAQAWGADLIFDELFKSRSSCVG